MNGGTVLAIAGSNYCIVAGSTRLSTGYSILTRDKSKLNQISPRCVIASGGFQGDIATLTKRLKVCESSACQAGCSAAGLHRSCEIRQPAIAASSLHVTRFTCISQNEGRHGGMYGPWSAFNCITLRAGYIAISSNSSDTMISSAQRCHALRTGNSILCSIACKSALLSL